MFVDKQKFSIFVVSNRTTKLSNTMNDELKDVLRVAYSEFTQVQLRLKMMKFLMDHGASVDERELDKLLIRFSNLKKLIDELEKQL